MTAGLPRSPVSTFDFMRVSPEDDASLTVLSPGAVTMAIADNGYASIEMQLAVEIYVQQVVRAGRAVMTAVAVSLEADEHAFDVAFERPFWLARLIRYPGRSDGENGRQFVGTEGESLGCGAHCDYGFLTFVTEEQPGAVVSALQVSRSGRDEDFMNIPMPPKGSFVLNFGDCLEALTNGEFYSTLHRVVRPATERLSIAVFVKPDVA